MSACNSALAAQQWGEQHTGGSDTVLSVSRLPTEQGRMLWDAVGHFVGSQAPAEVGH